MLESMTAVLISRPIEATSVVRLSTTEVRTALTNPRDQTARAESITAGCTLRVSTAGTLTLFTFEDEESVTAGTFAVDIVSVCFGLSVLRSKNDSAAIFVASLVLVFRTIAVETDFEATELAREHASID